MSFEPKFLGTAIGSMPFDNAEYAVSVSLKNLPDAPTICPTVLPS